MKTNSERLELADQFYRELYASVEQLEELSQDTLANTIYLVGVILFNDKISVMEEEGAQDFIKLIRSLPSASTWLSYIEIG